MDNCTKCGVKEICAWIFRGREYCLDCYKFRKEQSQVAENFIIKQKFSKVMSR